MTSRAAAVQAAMLVTSPPGMLLDAWNQTQHRKNSKCNVNIRKKLNFPLWSSHVRKKYSSRDFLLSLTLKEYDRF